VLAAPRTGVGRVHTDHRDTAPGRHADQSIPESAGGDAGDGAAQPFPARTAAQGFASGGAGVGEVEVFHHNRRTVVVVGVVEQGGDRRAHPPVTVAGTQSRGVHLEADRGADRIARLIEHTAGQVAVVEVHPQHPTVA
jgi:hypothetical protein